jgi:hypothetical protein
VQGQFRAEVDAPVLKTIAVKRALAAQMGLSLEQNQDPGPLSFTDLPTQQAIDIFAGQRLKFEALSALREKFGMVLPQQATPETPKTKEKAAKIPPPPDPTGFYAEVFRQLVDREPIDQSALKGLGKRRANAIIQELKAADGVDAARMAALEPVQATENKGKGVVSKLKIVVRK